VLHQKELVLFINHLILGAADYFESGNCHLYFCCFDLFCFDLIVCGSLNSVSDSAARALAQDTLEPHIRRCVFEVYLRGSSGSWAVTAAIRPSAASGSRQRQMQDEEAAAEDGEEAQRTGSIARALRATTGSTTTSSASVLQYTDAATHLALVVRGVGDVAQLWSGTERFHTLLMHVLYPLIDTLAHAHPIVSQAVCI
jgi:hypothetical protein